MRHAYLIMAHHKFDILKLLLEDLDDEDNDIFLHIDSKAVDCPMEELKVCLKHSKLYFVPSMDVHWAGYTQIKCIMRLLRYATELQQCESEGGYAYYHFMVGVEFPLKSQKYIHEFFRENKGYEFIGYDPKDTIYPERVRYYHFFNECFRGDRLYKKVLAKLDRYLTIFQKIIGVDCCKKYNLVLKKGNANWSITHELATYIVEQEKQIEKMYKHALLADEVFIHTLVYNNKEYYNRVYDKKDEYHSCMRLSQWNNPTNQYHVEDVDMLIHSGRLFARKIDGEDALEVIRLIKEKRTE